MRLPLARELHRSDSPCRNVGVFIVDRKVEHRRTASGSKSRLNELDELCGALPRYVYRDVRMRSRKFLNVAVFKLLAVCIFMRPKLDGDGFGLFSARQSRKGRNMNDWLRRRGESASG